MDEDGEEWFGDIYEYQEHFPEAAEDEAEPLALAEPEPVRAEAANVVEGATKKAPVVLDLTDTEPEPEEAGTKEGTKRRWCVKRKLGVLLC